MRAVIYSRFSSTHQTELSIEAQVRACREYAEKHHMNIIRVYNDEAVSGTTSERASYQEMLSDAIDDQFDVILIHKYDRIARNLTEQVNLDSKLKKLGIKLIAVAQDYGEGKDADLTKGIQWVLGGYYSANLSEEVKKGHKEIALKGLHNGGVAPFGYDIVDQKYVINDIEAAFVRRMFNAALNGASYKDIIEDLHTAGITGKRGRPMGYSSIYEILNNEKYTGTYVYSVNEETSRELRRCKPNAIRIENAIPNIIDKETFIKVQEILRSRKNSGKQMHRCSGLVYCGNCGAKMHVLRSERRGHKYNNFVCSKTCGIGIVPIEIVDNAVDEYLKLFFSEENKHLLEKEIRRIKQENTLRTKSFEKEKQTQLVRKEAELQNIMQAIASGAFTDNFDMVNNMLTEKRAEIEATKRMKPDSAPDDKIRKWVDALENNKAVPKLFIEKIIANKNRVEIITNFDSVVGNIGCGGTLPRILRTYEYN